MSASIVISLILFFIVFTTIVFIISNRLKMKHVTNEQTDIKRTIEDKTNDNFNHLNQIKKTHSVDKSLLNQQITTKTNEFRKLYNDLYDVDEELDYKIDASHAFLYSNINSLMQDLNDKKMEDLNRNSHADERVEKLEDSAKALSDTDTLYNARITSNADLLTRYGQNIVGIQNDIATNMNLITSNLTYSEESDTAILKTTGFIQDSNNQRFANIKDNLNTFFKFNFTGDDADKNWYDKNFHEAIDEYYSRELNSQYSTMTDLIGRVHSNDYFRDNTYVDDKRNQGVSNQNVNTFMGTQITSNVDFDDRIELNRLNIGTNTTNITGLGEQFSILNDSLATVGIRNLDADGNYVDTGMNLSNLNSNIGHNESNIRHFNSVVDNLFTSRFADILNENTSYLDNVKLKTKIEGLAFDDLNIGDTTFKSYSDNTTSRLEDLEAKSNISETNQRTFANYMTIGSAETTVLKPTHFGNNSASFDDVSQIKVGVNNKSIVEEMNERYMPLNRPIEICFANGPCLKPCDNGRSLCIDDYIIWDHRQASPPRPPQ